MAATRKPRVRRSSDQPCDGCVTCDDPRPQITIDLPEGDVCAVCVQRLVKRLRAENDQLKHRIAVYQGDEGES